MPTENALFNLCAEISRVLMLVNDNSSPEYHIGMTNGNLFPISSASAIQWCMCIPEHVICR